jgi:hypothetical protein
MSYLHNNKICIAWLSLIAFSIFCLLSKLDFVEVSWQWILWPIWIVLVSGTAMILTVEKSVYNGTGTQLKGPFVKNIYPVIGYSFPMRIEVLLGYVSPLLIALPITWNLVTGWELPLCITMSPLALWLFFAFNRSVVALLFGIFAFHQACEWMLNPLPPLSTVFFNLWIAKFFCLLFIVFWSNMCISDAARSCLLFKINDGIDAE